MQIKRGDDYSKSKRVVLIVIIDYDFELTKSIKKMETKWQLKDSENLGLVLTDKIEICIIELNKSQRAYKQKRCQWGRR